MNRIIAHGIHWDHNHTLQSVPLSSDTAHVSCITLRLLERYLSRLSHMAEEAGEVYKSAISSCSLLTSDKWKQQGGSPSGLAIVDALVGAKETMIEIRGHMRQMGEAAGIPIEPESQTQLLNATMAMEGVVLAGVPGAGGYDAVFAITLGDSGQQVTTCWSSHNVLALLVKEDPDGVRLENGDPRLKEITSAISSTHL